MALITDTHFGDRSDNQHLLAHQQRFFRETFFPILEKKSVEHVIHLGDLVDRRKFMNFLVQKAMNECFLDPLQALGIPVDILVGNHDTPYRHTNDGHALNLLLAAYPRFRIWDKPGHIQLGSRSVFMLPWIPEDKDTRTKILAQTKRSKAPTCLGHLDIASFINNDGDDAKGIDMEHLAHFDDVYTGHFHTRQNRDNISYLGSPYQSTWSDHGQPKGFHVWDTDTGDITFIRNPHSMFNVVEYNDSMMTPKDHHKMVDKLNVANTFVKVLVEHKDDSMGCDNFLTHILDIGVCDLKVIDTTIFARVDEDIDYAAEDTLAILKKVVHDYDHGGVDKDKLENFVVWAWNKAVYMREVDAGSTD